MSDIEYVCICGGYYTRGNKYRHLKSRVHNIYLDKEITKEEEAEEAAAEQQELKQQLKQIKKVTLD